MAKKAKKQTTRGRKQDRARVAGGQKYEVSYELKKTGRSAASVKRSRRSETCVSALKRGSGERKRANNARNVLKNEAAKRNMIARRLRQGWTRTRAMSGPLSVGRGFAAAIDV